MAEDTALEAALPVRVDEDPLSEAADPDEVAGEVADAPLEAEPLADPHSVCWSWRAAA